MATHGPVSDEHEPPIGLHELEAAVGRTWALNLIDRSEQDILVFMCLLEKGHSCEKAWQAMVHTAKGTTP